MISKYGELLVINNTNCRDDDLYSGNSQGKKNKKLTSSPPSRVMGGSQLRKPLEPPPLEWAGEGGFLHNRYSEESNS